MDLREQLDAHGKRAAVPCESEGRGWVHALAAGNRAEPPPTESSGARAGANRAVLLGPLCGARACGVSGAFCVYRCFMFTAMLCL